MDKLKKFTENLLNSEIKDFHQLSGGASAETYKLILTNKKKYILRRTPDSSESKLAISKKLEAKVQRIVKDKTITFPFQKFSMNLTKRVDLGAGMLWSLLVEKQFQEKY